MIEQFLIHTFAFLSYSKYILLGLGAYFEGSGAMMAGGYVLRLGGVSFWPLYGTLLVADILSDIMWYVIGYTGARSFMRRFGPYVNVTPPIVEKLEKKFRKNSTKILVISKLTMGLGLAVATLMTAGMLRVPFSKFLLINALGSIVWVLFLIGLGFLVGNVLSAIPLVYQIIFALIAIGLILALIKWLIAYIASESASV